MNTNNNIVVQLLVVVGVQCLTLEMLPLMTVAVDVLSLTHTFSSSFEFDLDPSSLW